jgi:hypothetical protein
MVLLGSPSSTYQGGAILKVFVMCIMEQDLVNQSTYIRVTSSKKSIKKVSNTVMFRKILLPACTIKKNRNNATIEMLLDAFK